MTLTDWIVIGVVALIVACAGTYIWQQKKKGVKCIGCPDGAACSKKGGCGSCEGCNQCKG